MEYCLLCLDGLLEIVSCIEVNSEKWQQDNLKFLIEKHFWPINSLTISSWMCIECVQQLQEFHKFYTRIEKAHTNLALLVKTEDEYTTNKNKENSTYTDEIGLRDDVNECFRPEIVMEQLIPKEFVEANFKSENINDDIQQNTLNSSTTEPTYITKLMLDDIKDPLEKSRKCKKNNSLSNNGRKYLKAKRSRHSKRNNSDNLDSEAIEIKYEPISEEFSLKYEKSNRDKEGSTDGDRNNKIKNNCKNKRNNPDEKTLKEYDRIIEENFQILCSICQIHFENFLALRKHFKVQHKQRGYARCCNRNFFTRSVLVDHIFVHLNPEHFKCQKCDKVFSDRSLLVNHLKLHEEDDSKLKKCDQCGKVFVKTAALKTHRLTHSSQKLFPCTICGKFFTNTYILNHHIEAIHQNKFVQICEICGKSIRCPTAFASHKETHEVKTTLISCDVCGLLLTNKLGLKRHKKTQHPDGGKKEHKCNICSKISPTLRALKAHIQRTHEMGYDYKCSLCEKAFKRPAVLKEHMATHTGTPLYNCPWCSKTFISNGNMYNHRKNAHPNEWKELQRQKYIESIT